MIDVEGPLDTGTDVRIRTRGEHLFRADQGAQPGRHDRRAEQTQRAKDCPIIGALARLLPPEQEVRCTTDPDRVMALAAPHGAGVERAAVVAARRGGDRSEIVAALAQAADRLQQRDRERLQRYLRASERYLREFQALALGSLPLAEANARAIELAGRMLPAALPNGDVS